MNFFNRTLVTFLIVILPSSIIFGQIKSETQSDESPNASKHFKYFNVSEINFGIGIGDGFQGSKGHYSYGIHTINGFLINSDISLGIGLGLDKLYIASNVKEVTPSISMDIRYFFLKKPITIYLACDGGYVFNLTGYNLGYRTEAYDIGLYGKYINPSIGSRIKVFKKSSLNLSLGLKIQETTINYISGILPKYEKLIIFKTGFSF